MVFNFSFFLLLYTITTLDFVKEIREKERERERERKIWWWGIWCWFCCLWRWLLRLFCTPTASALSRPLLLVSFFFFLDCFKFSLSGFFLFWWFEHSLLCFTISAARDEFVEDVTTVVSSIYFSFIWKQGLFSFGYILYFNFSLTKSKSTVNYTDFEWP